MTTRVRDLEALKHWLHAQPERYVVLREKRTDGHIAELNLLMDPTLAERLEARFPRARDGVKIDVYGAGRADYLGFAHLPDTLAQACLGARAPAPANAGATAGWYKAQPDDELAALLYHLAYHKPDASGLALDTVPPFAQAARPGVYTQRLRDLFEQTGTGALETLPAVHHWLSQRSLSLDTDRLHAYVRHQFKHGIKSYFHAWLMDQAPGELNLYVIRGIAVRYKQVDALLHRLSGQYRVIAQKAVPWDVRLMKMRHMRGGKWKRGGKPYLAVVVFDADPQPASVEERQVHPYVFNARQFIKREWREWFTQQTSARPQDNPIHSTDNEAEAIGHLPLFFDDAEQQRILADVAQLRATLYSEANGRSSVS